MERIPVAGPLITQKEIASPKQDRQTIYVCPETKRPLYESENRLTRDDGRHYNIRRGWNNIPIPDFVNPHEVGDAGKQSLTMYDQPVSVEIYRNYLSWLFQTFGESESSFRRDLIRRLNLKRADRVLLVGCGLGDDIPAVMEAIGPEGEVYAQDLSATMIGAASRHVSPTHPTAKIFFSISNCVLLPFTDNYFDGAFHFGGINLFDDVRMSISEMARVVKPGARVVFGDEGVAPWLRDTEYGQAVITNNSLWNASAPVALLPPTATDVNLSWVLGNCFYIISFAVSDKTPYINMDVPHKGERGGTMRTRYFGKLEDPT
jgi:SAM-dependent methyltransferase